MRFIPIDKMKSLREAAKNGDSRARKIIIMQMNGEDFGSLLDEYFANPKTPNKVEETSKTEQIVNKEISPNTVEDNDITDPKLKKFLEYNGVKKGDIDYESTIEAYYQEFPKARPGANLEMKATDTDVEVNLPNDEDDGSSIYGEEDEKIEDDVKFDSPTQHHVQETVATEEKNDLFNKLMGEEIDAIRSYDDAILKVMNSSQYNDNEKKGIIARLEEIKHDEREHWEELKRLKENSIKKEENGLVE